MKLKFSFLLLLLIFGISFSQSKTDLAAADKINQYADRIDKDSSRAKYTFEIPAKGKLIRYEYEKEGNEIIKMTRKWDENNGKYTDTYSDYFLLKNEAKVLALQSITYKNKSDATDIGGWNCKFWIKNDRVINMTSLGHGKTERDDWDYELELKENFSYMLKTVKNFDKKLSQKK